MSKGIEIKLNRKAGEAILKGKKTRAMTEQAGKKIQSAAGGKGFAVDTFTGTDRARTHVTAVSYQARRAEAEDRDLTRALGAGK